MSWTKQHPEKEMGIRRMYFWHSLITLDLRITILSVMFRQLAYIRLQLPMKKIRSVHRSCPVYRYPGLYTGREEDHLLQICTSEDPEENEPSSGRVYGDRWRSWCDNWTLLQYIRNPWSWAGSRTYCGKCTVPDRGKSCKRSCVWRRSSESIAFIRKLKYENVNDDTRVKRFYFC